MVWLLATAASGMFAVWAAMEWKKMENRPKKGEGFRISYSPDGPVHKGPISKTQGTRLRSAPGPGTAARPAPRINDGSTPGGLVKIGPDAPYGPGDEPTARPVGPDPRAAGKPGTLSASQLNAIAQREAGALGSPLEGEPGDLKSFPGARRLLGLQRLEEDGSTIQTAVYEVKEAGPDKVVEHYAALARDMGLEQVARRAGRAISVTYVGKGQAAGRMLSIRAAAGNGATRITVDFHYTMGTPTDR